MAQRNRSSRIRSFRWIGSIAALPAWILGGLWLTAGLIQAEETGTQVSTTAVESTPGITFLTKKTRLWMGRSQVLSFKAVAIGQGHVFTFHADPKYLQVLMPPSLLPGESVGYIRLRPQVIGKTRITLDGASLAVEIVRDETATSLEQSRPEIVSPARNAVVWGTFIVGVERVDLANALDPAPVLRLPSGQELTAQVVPASFPGSHLRYTFTVDTQSLSPGSNALVAISRESSGSEIRGDPIHVVVAHPEPTAILTGDCKDQIATVPPGNPRVGPPRPFRRPTLITDPQWAAGQVVMSQGENPPWCMVVKIPADGVYGLTMTVRGDIGGDALPTLGVMVDNARNTMTTSRLGTTEWQRIPVGVAFSLTAGSHTLSVHLLNAFGSGPKDSRHLYLARYELARLDQPAAPVVASNGAGSMMMMQGASSPNTLETISATKPGQPVQVENFQVLFRDAIDGKTITGDVQVNAVCGWPMRDRPAPPRVDLLVNDHVVASMTRPQPVFHVAVSAFHPGENKIQLQGRLPDGEQASSSVETLFLPTGLNLHLPPFRPGYAFFPADPAWNASMAPHLNPKDPDPTATFYHDGDSVLTLPEGLQGAYKLSIEAKGADFMGPAAATLVLRMNGVETQLGQVSTTGRMVALPVAQTTFVAGPKSLILRFANDGFVPGKGIRTLFVHSVLLDPVEANPEKTLPIATMMYPAAGAKVGFADAVVGNVFAVAGIAKADLLIDGQAQQLDIQPKNGLGPVMFPLLTRGLAPGRHRVQIVVQDQLGEIGKSGEVAISVTGQDHVAGGPYDRAVFLLNRFGYGPEADNLAAVLTKGPRAWLAAQLNETDESPREKNQEALLDVEFPDPNSVVQRVLKYLVAGSNPVRARFVAWTENHFSTWIKKDGTREKSQEHHRFLELGVAPFPNLLFASATSPAMLLYLDQRNSVNNHLNENYAREIMELHTLGVKGGYTQKDVTTLANLLTGWTVSDEASPEGANVMEHTFQYDPFLNSGDACQILGMTFPQAPPEKRLDRVVQALEMLSAHPSCAQFISRKLAEHYVSDPAPPQLVEAMAKTYLETGGDMRAVLTTMSENPAFWAAAPRVATPLEFGVRLGRLAGLSNLQALNVLINQSGMGVFDRYSPDGYPDASDFYSNSNGLLERWRFAEVVQNDFLNNGLFPQGWRPKTPQWDVPTIQRLVDLAAMRITGSVLTDSTNTAALQLLASAPETTDRLRLLTLFLCQAPETSLR